jgi:hypothetical protein
MRKINTHVFSYFLVVTFFNVYQAKKQKNPANTQSVNIKKKARMEGEKTGR